MPGQYCAESPPEEGAFRLDCAAAPSAPAEEPVRRREKPSPNIEHCPDGAYRWIYEFNMKRSPVILMTVLRVFGLVCALLWLFMVVLALTDGDPFLRSLWSQGKVALLIFAVFAVLAVPAYFIVAAVNGGKYIVLFEMDEEGVTHTQEPRQFTKAQGLQWLAAMAGAALHDPALTGAGFLGAARSALRSDFSRVRRVKVLRRWNTIKLNQPLAKNQVYAAPEDMDFVLDYIRARLPAGTKGL